MKTSQLKIALSRLKTFKSPDPALEQYTTPPEIAADVLVLASLHIDGQTIIDLGAGTGILSIGAGLLGFTVSGYEKDPEAVKIAEENLEQVEAEHGDIDVTFTVASIDEVDDQADAVIMNPPFGIQQDDANLDFLDAAFRTADTVFALLHRSGDETATTRQFIKEFASNRGYDAGVMKQYSFRLPRSMDFHDQEQARIGVDLYRFQAR